MRLPPVHSISTILFVAALFFAHGTAAQVRDSAQQGFLQIPGIDGGATHMDHRGWIRIDSISPVRPEAAKPSTEVAFSKPVDQASPKLLEAFKKGTRFSTASIDVPYSDAGRVTYLKYELKNVQVTSYQVSGRIERITLTCEKIDRAAGEAVAAPRR